MADLSESTDVYFCAFLLYKAHKIVEYEVISKGKVKCKFNISVDEWKKLKLEFNDSDILKFKSLINHIKDLAY